MRPQQSWVLGLRRAVAAVLLVAALQSCGRVLFVPHCGTQGSSWRGAVTEPTGGAGHGRFGPIATSFRGIHHRCRLARRRASDEESVEGDAEDTTNVELFRQSLIQGWGTQTMASGPENSKWAEALTPDSFQVGDLLLGNPIAFYGEGSNEGPQRVGMRSRIPDDGSRRDLLRVLPVLLLTKLTPGGDAAEAVWLTLRTGNLMGDFVPHFHSRPLLFGGPCEADLTMVHPYPQVPDCEPLEGGLYLGGNFTGAQEWVDEGEGSSLRFRFFVNRVRWGPGELKREVGTAQDGRPWIPVRCSVDLVLSEVDDSGEKPLWVQVAELAGGAVARIGREFDLL